MKAVHLDKVPDDLVRTSLVPKLRGMEPDSSETLVLFCSPQYLAKRGWFRAELLWCNARGILRLVGVDEAHIHAMHGRSFRDPIRVLRDTFFQVLYGPGAAKSPLFLAMTATMIGNLLPSFSALVSVDCCSPIHQLWATAEEFQQRNVSIELHVRGGRKDLKQIVLAPVVSLLRDDAASMSTTQSSGSSGREERVILAPLSSLGPACR